MGVILHLRAGFETKALRDQLGLKKTSRKLAETFAAHCVDSWAIAWDIVGGNEAPDNRGLLCIQPISLHRRQLHRLQPQKGGERLSYCGTSCHGFKRGSLIRHAKWGLTYVGGVLLAIQPGEIPALDTQFTLLMGKNEAGGRRAWMERDG